MEMMKTTVRSAPDGSDKNENKFKYLGRVKIESSNLKKCVLLKLFSVS